MTAAEQQIVMRLAQQEPGALLSLLAGCLTPAVSVAAPSPCRDPLERRAGDDPFLITEEEFAFRARYMSEEEEVILRCRVNAARSKKAGQLDQARRQSQRADRLERKLGTLLSL